MLRMFKDLVPTPWLMMGAVLAFSAIVSGSYLTGRLHGAAKVEARYTAQMLTLEQHNAAARQELAEAEQRRALERLTDAHQLRAQINDYEKALQAGSTAACPADAEYTRRMHNIAITDQPDPAGR